MSKGSTTFAGKMIYLHYDLTDHYQSMDKDCRRHHSNCLDNVLLYIQY